MKTSGMVAVRFTLNGGELVLEQIDGALELRVIGTSGRETQRMWIESEAQAMDMVRVMRQLAREVCP